MATTAHQTDEEKKEYFDTPEDLDMKVTQLAEWIKESKHFIAFTGAGVSTSAGIPDYRSGMNTVLKTGPGAWEKAASGKSIKAKIRAVISQAIPTSSHMALCAMEQAGYLKFLISQVITLLINCRFKVFCEYRMLMVCIERVVFLSVKWLRSMEILT